MIDVQTLFYRRACFWIGTVCLLLLMYDRYFYVTDPLEYQSRDVSYKSRVCLVIFVCFIVETPFTIINYLFLSSWHDNCVNFRKANIMLVRAYSQRIYAILDIIASLVVVFLSIFYAFKLSRTMKKHVDEENQSDINTNAISKLVKWSACLQAAASVFKDCIC